jgi:hypothetical protein
MDIQTRKYSLIEYLIRLSDETILSKIETAISSVKKNKIEQKIEPFTQVQLLNRARKSNDEYLAGNYKTQEQVEKESANW